MDKNNKYHPLPHGDICTQRLIQGLQRKVPRNSQFDLGHKAPVGKCLRKEKQNCQKKQIVVLNTTLIILPLTCFMEKSVINVINLVDMKRILSPSRCRDIYIHRARWGYLYMECYTELHNCMELRFLQ